MRILKQAQNCILAFALLFSSSAQTAEATISADDAQPAEQTLELPEPVGGPLELTDDILPESAIETIKKQEIEDFDTEFQDAASPLSTVSTEESSDLSHIELDIDTQVTEKLSIVPDLEQIDQLIEIGALQLAHHLLQSMQSEQGQPGDAQMRETRFLDVAFQTGDYQGILDRIDEIGQSEDIEFLKQLQLRAVAAEFELQRFAALRHRVRNLIWQLPYDQTDMIVWRDWIVRSYVAEDRLEDAAVALAEFYRDYRPSDPHWEERYARVLLSSGEYELALARLQPLQTSESALLRLFARYKLRQIPPLEMQTSVLDLLPQFENSPFQLAELWSIVESNARDINDYELRLMAIESGLSIRYSQSDSAFYSAAVPPATIKRLLAAYHEYAFHVGNDFNLVIGDDESWMRLAYEFEITSMIAARALYSFLASQTQDPHVRRSSIEAFASTLAQDGLTRLLHLLFIDSGTYPIDEISAGIQTALANRAIVSKDYIAALTVLNAMAAPAGAAERETWTLTRARLAVAVDQFGQADALVTEAIRALPVPAPIESIDKIKQVLFEMQEKQQHESAIALFEQIYAQVGTDQLRREILRWISDSFAALDEPVRTAEFLLRSALLGDDWSDDWGRAARLRAADRLSEAALFQDARVLYEGIYEDTLNPRGRAVIENKLKNLPRTE